MGRSVRRANSRSYERSSYSRSPSRSYSDDSRRSGSYSARSRSSSHSRSSRGSYRTRSYSRSSRSQSNDSRSPIHNSKPSRSIQEEWPNNKPCKHVFCHKCATLSSKVCSRCGKDVDDIDRCVVGRIFMCTENSSCCRTYLSEADLEAHIKHRHRQGIVCSSASVTSTNPLVNNTMAPASFTSKADNSQSNSRMTNANMVPNIMLYRPSKPMSSSLNIAVPPPQMFMQTQPNSMVANRIGQIKNPVLMNTIPNSMNHQTLNHRPAVNTNNPVQVSHLS